MPNRRTLKKTVHQILRGEELDEIDVQLRQYKEQDLINPLFSALCSTDESIRWHAVSAFGQVVSRIAGRDLESARIIMRRFLWSLNDESGGIGWGAPEAMAEIMTADCRIAQEYLHMLISYMREDGPELFQDGNYLELPLLQRGLIWGIGRMCSVHQDEMNKRGVAADLRKYLVSDDHVVAGLAIWALGSLADSTAYKEVLSLADTNCTVPVYMDGQLQQYTLKILVAQYLEKLDEHARC